MKLLYVNQYFPELFFVGAATAEPNQYFPELFFVGAATAEPEAPVPGRPDYPCGDLDGRKNENTTNGCQNEIK